MSRVYKSFGMKLNPRAVCVDCPKEWPTSAATREVAKGHAKATGHTVEVVTQIIDHYRRETS